VNVTSTTIRGGVPISGPVTVSGFKHALVLSLAYAVGSGSAVTLWNTPDILETSVYRSLLPELGVDIELAAPMLRLDATGPVRVSMPEPASRIHGSLYLLPALLARNGIVRFSPDFGGCRIGATTGGERPWRHVVGVLERFGATVDQAGGEFTLRAGQLRGTDIDLRDFATDRRTLAGPEYSGATKAAVLSAALADGPSVLRFPYMKSEVVALLGMLRVDGVGVTLGEDSVVISGRTTGPRAREFRLPADLIEVATWVTIAAATGGAIELLGVLPQEIDEGLRPEKALWKTIGVELVERSDSVLVTGPESGEFGDLPLIETLPSSIYSDSQPLFAVLATRCPGQTRIIDTVWTGRYGYLDGLTSLGARITREPAGITVGHGPLRAPEGGIAVSATDLRAAAALLTGALMATGGPVTVHGVDHLHRGYDRLFDKLSACLPAGHALITLTREV
jgi:UDP-N-acetylglucosamine 1-carboxyvinyltransferase